MHSQSSRTAGGSGCRSASTAAHGVLPFVRLFGRATHASRLSQPSQQRLRTSGLVVYAQPGPDKGSVAALEAAISAINNILGTYNKVRGGKIGPGGSPAGVSSKGGALQRTSVGNGPSKLISFTAKASSSVPVKVRLCQFLLRLKCLFRLHPSLLHTCSVGSCGARCSSCAQMLQ